MVEWRSRVAYVVGWATSGPAEVPADNNWPPVGWGNTYSKWEERVERWRRQPAKERRACRDPRQRTDPTMHHVMMLTDYGDIKWSDGNGQWELKDRPTILKRGFWTKLTYRDPGFIGETWEEAMSSVKAHFDKKIHLAQVRTNAALKHFIEFEEKNKMKVLDHIVTVLDQDVD